MFKSLQCIMLISSMVSISLFGGKNIGLTKEIENRRECIVCSVNSSVAEDSGEYALGYTDGFWVEEDETIYLLKSYGNAVLEVKKNSRKEIPLSAAALPACIISDENNLYIYDDILCELQIYTKQGELLVRQKIDLAKDYVKNLVKIKDGIAVLTYGGKQIPVECQSGKLNMAEAEHIPNIDAAGFDYAEYIGTDEDGTVYSVHTTLVDNCSVLAGEMTLRAVTAEGVLKGSYILPTQECVYLPGQYVHVMDNGNIYLLIPTEETVEVRKIALKESVISDLSVFSEAAAALENKYASDVRSRIRSGLACTEEITMSREETRQRADAMAEYKWTLKKTHTLTSKSEKGVVLPREIAFWKAENADKSSWSVEITGIPYCWGGFYALDVGFGGKTFQQVVDNKYVAGNIEPKGNYKYMTAGLDCSGYVSAVFCLPSKKNTGALSCLGSKVSDVRNLEQMDILVWPGEHIIFFYEWIDDATMLVSESNVRNGKVIIHPKTLNELIVDKRYQMRSPW
ncbi:MAG: hypothetical protein J6J44_08025 [Lachnospiraceae bacterium]|nr:hypothetical protein [Lachnospiraceae bacterium]